MDALYNNRDTWMVANIRNNGALPFLPEDAVIETACMANASGFRPVLGQQPPRAICGLIAAVKSYEQLAVEAAVTGDRDTALLALVSHPLVREYDVAVPLLEELLEANREYLPQFFGK